MWGGGGCRRRCRWSGREGFEVGPLDGDADRNVVVLHFIDAFGAGVVREPIFSFDVLAISLEYFKRQRRRLDGAQIGNPFSVGFDNFEIFLVDPNDAVEERMLAVEGFGSNLENVAIDFVDLFGIQILDVVFGELARDDRERGNTREKLRIFRLELKILQRGGRGGNRFFIELAVIGMHRVVGGRELSTGTPIRSEFLNTDGLAISKLRACPQISLFFFSEDLDNFRGRERRGSFGLGNTGDALYFVFGRRSKRTGSVFLSEDDATRPGKKAERKAKKE